VVRRGTPLNGCQLYIPAAFAQGFQTHVDDTVTRYLISEYHPPEAGRGLRYDDPAIGVAWPAEPSLVSSRDLSWPTLQEVPA
jgi:dTDP-4-dehydrorhamnose 3,5-epimerase